MIERRTKQGVRDLNPVGPDPDELMYSGPMYDRRVIDIRTRLVHASTLDRSGHYDYIDELACETYVSQRELFLLESSAMLTCFGCLVVCG